MSMNTEWYLTLALLAFTPLQAAPPFEYYSNNVAPYTEQAWEAEIPLLLNRVETTGDANLRSSSGFTALQAACRVGDEALVNKLLDMGADVNARDAQGRTPLLALPYVHDLRIPQQHSCAPIIRLLAEAGADLNACDKDGYTRLELMLRCGNLSLPDWESAMLLQQLGCAPRPERLNQ